MSNPITNARALLAIRDETAKFAGYPDHKLAEAMRELLREVERMRAEEARCIDAADAAVREDERRHAEVVQAAMERERLLQGERDELRTATRRLRAMLAVPAAEYVPAMADALMLLQDLDPTDANKETPDAR